MVYIVWFIMMLAGYFYVELDILQLTIVTIIFITVHRLTLTEMYWNSVFKTIKLVPTNLIGGPIRSGKDLLAVALTHLNTERMQWSILLKMINIRIRAKLIDYRALHSYMNRHKDEINEKNYREYAKAFFDKLLVPNYKYNTHMNRKKSMLDYVEDYTWLYYIKYIRKNYIQSNMFIYDRNRKQTSYVLRDLDFRLAETKEYVLSDNMNYVITEGNITYPNYMSKEEEAKFKSSGIPQAMATFGHLTSETSVLFSTVQDRERPIKVYRTLFAGYLEIQKKFKIIGSFELARKSLVSMIFVLESINVLLRFTSLKINIFSKLTIPIQLFQGILAKLNDFLFSFAYIKTYAKYYTDGDKEIGKRFNVVLPAKQVFGCYNTHFFRGIHDQLTEGTATTLKDRRVFKSHKLSLEELNYMGYEEIMKLNNINADLMNSVNSVTEDDTAATSIDDTAEVKKFVVIDGVEHYEGSCEYTHYCKHIDGICNYQKCKKCPITTRPDLIEHVEQIGITMEQYVEYRKQYVNNEDKEKR